MKKALVIEDNEDNRVLIARILEKSGYEVLTAVNGQMGYEMAVATEPDFILLDIQLPDMNGVEVLEKLRENGNTKKIPIIAVTSYAMSGDQARLLAKGCNGYIEKPIDPMRVIQQIEQALESIA